jgi:hypothetical protein
MSINIHNSAPLSSRLFMILRELPSYLSTAYSLRFKDRPQGNLLYRILQAIARVFILLKELISYRPSRASFLENMTKMDEEFAKINATVKEGKKAICAYFVNDKDHNGGVLGDPVYYYHHYKIRKYQKHFDVSAKVIRSVHDMFKHLKKLKRQCPDRPIKVVEIVAHGTPTSTDISVKSVAQQMSQANLRKRMNVIRKQNIVAKEKHRQILNALLLSAVKEEGEIRNYNNRCKCYCNDQVQEKEFADCAKDAVIILHGCSTGKGRNSLAETIAQNNPGKTVFAPGSTLFFSKPIFATENQSTKIATVMYGYVFGVFYAYTAKKFRHAIA